MLGLTAAASATDAAINKKILGSGHHTTVIISGFLSMLLGTFGASLLGDLLTKNLSARGVIRAGEGTIRAGYGSKKF